MRYNIISPGVGAWQCHALTLASLHFLLQPIAQSKRILACDRTTSHLSIAHDSTADIF
ncbi:MAG: hypothetical protein V7K32_03860 [Nostoc sp.]|uniref:hypothetical protein n=1 Tax=Nostoc sp. TaxID=1180 RepID=UPI002FF6EAF4